MFLMNNLYNWNITIPKMQKYKIIGNKRQNVG